jgi:DNA ligase OB-like domain/ATP dependent DNA ligase domain
VGITVGATLVFKPNLAAKADFNLLRFPLLASPKIDGFRMTVHNGVGMSRSMKPIPNRHLQAWVQRNSYSLEGLDGEVVVGPEAASDVFEKTSALRQFDGVPEFTYLVFDNYQSSLYYRERYAELNTNSHRLPIRARVLPHVYLTSIKDVEDFEVCCLDTGFEGIMLRNPLSHYKQGRSTVLEGGLLKVKRYVDAEAVIIGKVELLHNTNPEFQDETGYAKRSKVQSGLVPAGMMGVLVVKGVNGQFKDVEFEIGTGFSLANRKTFWEFDFNGHILTYKYFPIGSQDRPRHPVFKSLRPSWDATS